jgi:hypothetical protein
MQPGYEPTPNRPPVRHLDPDLPRPPRTHRTTTLQTPTSRTEMADQGALSRTGFRGDWVCRL